MSRTFRKDFQGHQQRDGTYLKRCPSPNCNQCGENQGIYEGDTAALIVALSRAAEPMLEHLREIVRLWKYGSSPGPVVMDGAKVLAIALLGEVE